MKLPCDPRPGDADAEARKRSSLGKSLTSGVARKRSLGSRCIEGRHTGFGGLTGAKGLYSSVDRQGNQDKGRPHSDQGKVNMMSI